MIKNNITLSVNIEGYNELLDYDNDTAIGLNFNAYHVDNIKDLHLDYTRTFTLPKTARNNLIFSHINSVHSVSKFPYDKYIMKIAVDGVVIMQGGMFVESVADRYNVQLVVSIGLFNKLKDLPFFKFEGEDSLIKRIVDNWNNVVLPNDVSGYYDPAITLNNVLMYCNETETDGEYTHRKRMKHDFVVPAVLNQFAYKRVGFSDADGNIGTLTNNMFTETTTADNTISNGFYLAKFFSSGTFDKKWDAANQVYQYNLGANNGDYRRGQSVVSPFWCSIRKIIELLEDYTGYTFVNLEQSIIDTNKNSLIINGNLPYIHCIGAEFEFNFNMNTNSDTESTTFSGDTYIGRMAVLSKDGYKTNVGDSSTNTDISLDDMPGGSCLDLLKMIMHEFCLVADINETRKTITFRRFEEIDTEEAENLVLFKENNKKFTIDNLSQVNVINYEGNKDISLAIDVENKNIEAKSDLFTIQRRRDNLKRYGLAYAGGGYVEIGKTLDLTNSNIYKNFEIAYPFCYTTNGQYGLKHLKKAVVSVSMIGEHKDLTSKKHIERTIATSDNLQCFQTGLYCNTMLPSDIIDNLSYLYFQEVVRYPRVLDVEVIKDVRLLHNWSRLKKVHINGLVGYYYIQSINDFNPRTDNTMTLTLIKLPPVVVDVFKAIITENDIELITENDIQVITEDSKN